jgi:hypothetical protein
MCFGENGSDTLRDGEQVLLRTATSQRLPRYDCTLRTNDDAITWAVLSPAAGDALPRFTICRIAPAIMVLVEGEGQARRFASAPTVEDALAFAEQVVQAALFTGKTIHSAPEMVQ